jgi:hypothetical protein
MDKDRKEVLRLYKKIQSEHDLEDLRTYEEEFGFYTPIPTAFIPELIANVMRKLGSIRNCIRIFLSPNGFIEAYESKFLTNKEKENLFPFFKKLIALDWEYASEFNKGTDERVKFLKKIVDFYRKEAKIFIQKFGNNLKNKWLEEDSVKEINPYIS